MFESLSLGGFLVAVLAAAVRRGTPMAFAAVGEAISERAGVLNLGVEGMMLVGAMVAVAVRISTGSALLALLAAGTAASVLAAFHAGLVIWLRANQLVSGFAITVLGTGLSGFLGRPLVGVQVDGIDRMSIPVLRDLPVLGPILFQQDPLVYFSIILAAAAWLFLHRTRPGLEIRAVGEDPQSAYAHGVRTAWVRFGAVVGGGFWSGIGGAHLSIAYTDVWAEKMTAGQGWIAVGLVIVARWSPAWSLVAAWLFGAVTVLHPHLQAAGVDISQYAVAALPYLLAVVALTLATLVYRRKGWGVPGALAEAIHIGGAGTESGGNTSAVQGATSAR